MLNPFAHRKILKKGTPGRARIMAFQMPERGASKQNIRMTLEVRAEGLPPYEVEDQWLVSSKDSLGFGLDVPVKVDAKDQQRVAIDWEGARAERSAEKGARREALAAQPPVTSQEATARPATAADPAQASAQIVRAETRAAAEPPPPSAGEDDTISRLERLAKLRDGGALSEEEFESEKRRLLGGT